MNIEVEEEVAGFDGRCVWLRRRVSNGDKVAYFVDEMNVSEQHSRERLDKKMADYDWDRCTAKRK